MKTMRVAVVERVKLADILRGIGRPDSVAMDIGDAQLIAEPGPFRVGIGYVDGRFEAPPHFVVVPGPDRREFFAWVNTYCPFVTPLSQWCRVVTEPELALVRKARVPSYGGVEAAWAGAVIGEAVLRLGTGRRLAEMTTTALQTCATFVAARARGLWGVDDARWEWMAQYETARRTLGVGDRDSSLSNYRTVWEVLDALSDEGNEVVQAMEWRKRLIVQACADIRKMGFVREGTMLEVVGELGWPTVYTEYERMGAEGRVQLYDNSVECLDRMGTGERESLGALAEFVVAYFAATVGGSAAGHMGLLEKCIGRYPMLAVWYGVASALYRPEVWGTEFGGLARLALRELAFPWRFEDPPRCDIAVEELTALVEPGGREKSLGFRGAALKTLSVEVALGVNAMIALPAASEQEASGIRGEVVQAELAKLMLHLNASAESAGRLDEEIGWAAGGKPFGKNRRQIGRKRTLAGRKGKDVRDDDQELPLRKR